jgi:transcriptional regulator with XRE-family HTH domain
MGSATKTRANVSRIVQELLTLTGWSEVELAAKVGMRQPTVHRWKTGQNTASVVHLEKLLALLHEERQKRGLHEEEPLELDLAKRKLSHTGKEQLRAIILRTVRLFPLPPSPTPESLERWQQHLATQTELIEEAIYGTEKDTISDEERIAALELAVEIITEELQKFTPPRA